MPKWLRDVFVDLGAVVATAAIFMAAFVFGLLVAVKLGSNQPWTGILAAVGFLVFVAVPLRLWWVLRR